jgi:hypothetical protein
MGKQNSPTPSLELLPFVNWCIAAKLPKDFSLLTAVDLYVQNRLYLLTIQLPTHTTGVVDDGNGDGVDQSSTVVDPPNPEPKGPVLED